jgi:hypothetical protein
MNIETIKQHIIEKTPAENTYLLLFMLESNHTFLITIAEVPHNLLVKSNKHGDWSFNYVAVQIYGILQLLWFDLSPVRQVLGYQTRGLQWMAATDHEHRSSFNVNFAEFNKTTNVLSINRLKKFIDYWIGRRLTESSIAMIH